ncbi:MAG: hypothetical protein ACYC91_03925 [Solirubrobacteraceae bacterium]
MGAPQPEDLLGAELGIDRPGPSDCEAVFSGVQIRSGRAEPHERPLRAFRRVSELPS